MSYRGTLKYRAIKSKQLVAKSFPAQHTSLYNSLIIK